MKKIIGYELKCLRCGRTWPSFDASPHSCRYCKSSYWNKPRVRKERREKVANVPEESQP